MKDENDNICTICLMGSDEMMMMKMLCKLLNILMYYGNIQSFLVTGSKLWTKNSIHKDVVHRHIIEKMIFKF